MRINIKSNFYIPGLEGEIVEIRDASTVRQLLEHISEISEGTFVFFEGGKEVLDPDDWEVDVNGISYDGFHVAAETRLNDNDIVEIRLLMYSGG